MEPIATIAGQGEAEIRQFVVNEHNATIDKLNAEGRHYQYGHLSLSDPVDSPEIDRLVHEYKLSHHFGLKEKIMPKEWYTHDLHTILKKFLPSSNDKIWDALPGQSYGCIDKIICDEHHKRITIYSIIGDRHAPLYPTTEAISKSTINKKLRILRKIP